MNEQMRQKVIIGVLAIAAIGAGAFYMLRDSDSSGRKTGTKQVEGRLTRESSKQERVKRAPQKRESQKAEVAPRRQREQADRSSTERKKRRRGGGKKAKKKEITPAA